MTAAQEEQARRQMIANLFGALLCKTHKWILFVHRDDGLHWAASEGLQFSGGTQEPLSYLLERIIMYDVRIWALHAVTEPALSDEEIPLSLDLLVPMRAGAMSEAVTPSMLLQTYLKYAARTAEIMDYQLRLRGFQTMVPQELIRTVQFPKSKVAQNGLLLCHTLDINRKIEAAYQRDMAVWFSRSLLELYPFSFYQRIVGNVNGYTHYCVGAPDGLADAELLMQKELSILADYVQATNPLPESTLFRVLSPDTDNYMDMYSRDASVPIYNGSMLKLDKRYMILSCVPSLASYTDIQVDNPTKQLLLDKHKQDALAPLLEQCEKGLE